jgi:hypothetical protein
LTNLFAVEVSYAAEEVVAEATAEATAEQADVADTAVAEAEAIPTPAPKKPAKPAAKKV